MRGVALAAILLCAAACAGETSDIGAFSEAHLNALTESGDDDDADDEPDADHKQQASFLIVIEHPDGWRCSGSLVSLRTALSSAWCARGRARAPAAELWALAAAAAARPTTPHARQHGARRIVRLAVATDADAEVSDVSTREERERGEEASWRGGAMDLAVVELEEPFGSAALTVPILMATRAEECAAPAECHVARAVTAPPSRRARLRIASATLRRPDACASAAPHWAAVQDRALCLHGAKLCESDWGAGVVCGGKVCGVLSRSVRAPGDAALADAAAAADAAAGERSCGTTHAAQSTARWRRFLHCAHTLRACGSDGDCAELCVERRLVEEPTTPAWSQPAPAPPPPPTRAPPPPPPASHTPTPLAGTTQPTRTASPAPWAASATRSVSPALAPAVRTWARPAPRFRPQPPPPPAVKSPPPPPPPSPPPPPPALDDTTPALARFEFEPNRADFKAQPPRESPSVSVLKAGEYGDNAADYGGGDEPAPPTRTPPAAPAMPDAPPSPPPPVSGDRPPSSPTPESPSPVRPVSQEALQAGGGPAPVRSIPPAERRSAALAPAPKSSPVSAAPARGPILALLVLPLFVNTASCTG